MKRVLLIKKGVFALLLALSLGMGTAYASYDFSKVCSTGQTLYYNIIDATNHYVEITYPGTSTLNPWDGYTKPTGNITLPSTVTNIGVTYTVTKIGNYAFKGCNGLTGSLTIPNSVTSIGNYAFVNCSGFTGSLTIGNSVTTIGYNAFYGCNGFAGTGTLTLGQSVTSIDSYAFGDCGSFTSIISLPMTPPSLGTYAFYGLPLDIPLYVPCAALASYQAATQWLSYTNYQCLGYDLSAVCSTGQTLYYNITDATNHYVEITYPGTYATNSWNGFTRPTGSITLPSSVTYNGVTYTVKKIGNYAFQSCNGLTGSLTIPSSVTMIDHYAFDGCSGFTGSLIIPNSVTYIGTYAFRDCSGFTGSLTIPNSVTYIGRYAFYFCYGFTGSLTIGNSVTTINNCTFYSCLGFTGLTLGNSVSSIGERAFSFCSSFTGSLTIPNSVTTIGNEAFRYCSDFTSITALPETPPSLGTNPFQNIPTSIPVYVPCASLENYQSASGWSSFTNMQCIPELTVFDGTATNNYVPVYGYYTDAYLKAEFVMPAAELADIAGCTINSMKFYATQANVSWGNANFQVFLTEVADATISAFAGPGTVVYQGALSIVGGEMTVNFTTPYLYNGGNLLVGIYNTVKGSYVTSTWYGETVNNASVQGYSTSSLESVQPTQRNFIPKTSFTYTLSECARPNGLTATDITTTSAMLSWNGYQDSYDVRYRKKPLFFEDFENGLPSDWTTIDNDGDGYNWYLESNLSASYCHSGSTIMASASYDDFVGALTPDNWLVTPLLDLQGTMKVWIRAYSSGWPQEHFAIYLSTTGNSVSDFTTVLVPETTLTDAVYRAYTADLSAYEGQQGYIAIRHFNCSDMYEILLDDFGLYDDPSETGDWTMVEDIQGSALLLGSIDFDSEFEWQVRGRDCDGEGSYTEWSAANVFTTEALCAPEDKCLLTFTLTDSYGDGWNGAALDVYDAATNILLASLSAPNHGLMYTPTTDTYTLAVCDGRELMFWWESGNYDGECSYTVTDVNGNEVFSGTGAMSEPFNYIVDCPQQYIFLTNGNWNNDGCWSTGTVPPAGSDVIIQANVTVPAGCLAVANAVTLDGGSITVADGGQLKHNTQGLEVTMKKNIVGYDDANDIRNYYLLSFPFVHIDVPAAMSATGSDFYRFDLNEPNAEWRNLRSETFNIQLLQGYLFASPESNELSLSGHTYATTTETMWDHVVEYTDGSANPYDGWELLGNPLTYNVYIYRQNSDGELVPMPIMMYDANGDLQTIYGGPVAPMQGFFVHVTETTTVCFRGTALHEDDYVDLGLPSGLLWATCNVGANSPEDYGDYFAWGETTPKDVYNWSTYQYGHDWNQLTKYCNDASSGYNGFTDNLITLLPEDDAATANWGSGWRMPTREEWQELYNNTTVTWTTQNGVNGCLFTAANGNSLFLPATGYIGGTTNYSVGNVLNWSSSLYTDNQNDAIYFSYNSSYSYGNSHGYRISGQTVRPVRSPQTEHAYVDLGLPSGTKWATCNVGADSPEDYGDYFAWGETQPKETYDWSTYQYCNGSYNTLTKYCNRSIYGYNGFTDDLTTLLPEDDAATANWGSGWRMPTQAEWQELYNNTTVIWTTQNGVDGRLFTASNGNTLFLPVAGYRGNSGLYNAGGEGYYWSSSLGTGHPHRVLYFNFNSSSYYMIDIYRYCGHSVRAVRVGSQN